MEAMEPLSPATLRSRLRQILATTNDDEDLAATLVEKGILSEISAMATMDAGQVAEELSIQLDSVRKLARKSQAFPQPVITGRRYARSDVTAYAAQRSRRQ